MNSFTRRSNVTIALLAVATSSQIAGVGYDEPSKTLAVHFTPKPGEESGPLYNYFDVPADVGKEYLELVNRNRTDPEASVGSFFYAKVKPVYVFQRIAPEVGPVKNPDGTRQEEEGIGSTDQANTTQQAA